MTIGWKFNGTIVWNAHIMKKSRSVLIAVASLLISPLAIAQIYKCDGPDGPVYSDQECGPDAASVELAETSGISGVSDETKTELAQKKADRAEARTDSSSTRTNNNYQNNTVSTEPAGRWERRPYRKPDDKATTLPETGQKPAKSVVAKRRR
jgi:hypothetical protein